MRTRTSRHSIALAAAAVLAVIGVISARVAPPASAALEAVQLTIVESISARDALPSSGGVMTAEPVRVRDVVGLVPPIALNVGEVIGVRDTPASWWSLSSREAIAVSDAVRLIPGLSLRIVEVILARDGIDLGTKTALEELRDLVSLVDDMGLDAGQRTSFDAKLRSAAAALQRGNIRAACGQLGAFDNEVKARTGKSLTVSQADALLAAGERTRSLLRCP